MSDLRDKLMAEFGDPSAAYRPMMFWVWNGDLTPERIREQVADMADKGCGGFFLHPMGENFRLNDFIHGQSPGYLTEGFFEAVRVAVEAAEAEGLYAWLYDEGGWPSGTAQGAVVEGHPEHIAKVLKVSHIEGAGGDFICPEGTVAVLAVFPDHRPEVLEIAGGTVRVPSFARSLLIFRAEEVAGRVDLLSPAAVARFIEVTHQRYADYVGEHFGGTIPGIFTDEPAVSGRVASAAIPWTPRMLQTFEARRGFDLRPWLPALFSREAIPEAVWRHFEDTAVAQARCEFCDHWTDLYHDAYWRQINRWCEERGLLHTGHVGGEDNLLDHGRHGFGHFFKTAGALHAPGVDAIWRQLHWEKENFDFPRFASSAAHQRPGQGGSANEASPFDNLVVTETNGVYGFGLTYEQMKWLVDFQCLCGVNLIGPMSYSYETAGGRLYRTLEHIGPGNPQWELYGDFADYVGRLCALLRSGVALADIAVYYPIEAAWSDPDGPAAEEAWQSLQAVTLVLNETQTAFDFIDAQTIAAANVTDGALETDGQFYGTVVVPATPVMPAAAAARLLELYQSGGRVVFVEAVPAISAGLRNQDPFAAVTAELQAASVRLDRSAESGALGGDTREGLDEAARWDGLAAGLGMSPGPHFPMELERSQAVIIATAEELPRLAQLLSTRAGHYGLQTDSTEPDLRMTVREVGTMRVAFLMNQGQREITCDLALVEDQLAAIERWDARTGRITPIRLHEQVSEITRLPLKLRAGESALLVVDTEAPLAAPRREHHLLPQPAVIDVMDTPDAVYVVEQARIVNGDVDLLTGPAARQDLPCLLAAWEELGLEQFSGAVAYEFGFVLSEEYLDDEVFLDLGEVLYAAQVELNGQVVPGYLWSPFVVEVSDYLQAGDNSLRIVVANTLANQAVAETVVSEAKRNRWFNTYYERSLPMMEESLPSGLLGPVRLYLQV